MAAQTSEQLPHILGMGGGPEDRATGHGYLASCRNGLLGASERSINTKAKSCEEHQELTQLDLGKDLQEKMLGLLVDKSVIKGH